MRAKARGTTERRVPAPPSSPSSLSAAVTLASPRSSRKFHYRTRLKCKLKPPPPPVTCALRLPLIPSVQRAPPDHTERILHIPYSDIRQRYELGALVGEGTTGRVRRCQDLCTGQVLACKTLEKRAMASRAEVDSVRSEVCALQVMGKHPATVTLWDVLEDEENVHIITELCEGGDLVDRMRRRKRFSEREAAHVCQTILSALHYCHGKGIVHRDVKLENVVMVSRDSETDVKLADFGQAAFFVHGQELTRPVGSMYYVAPEVLNCSYGPEVDIWSLGITLYILLSGQRPFSAQTDEELLQMIRDGEVGLDRGVWKTVSTRAKDLVGRMLCRDPKARITLDAAQAHPWILQHCRPNSKSPECPPQCKTAADAAPPSPAPSGLSLRSDISLGIDRSYRHVAFSKWSKSFDLASSSTGEGKQRPSLSPSDSRSAKDGLAAQFRFPTEQLPTRNKRFHVGDRCCWAAGPSEGVPSDKWFNADSGLSRPNSD